MSYRVKLTCKPSELSRDGTTLTELFSPNEKTTTLELDSVADLEGYAAMAAADFGKPCVVWASLPHGQRKPPRYDAISHAVARVFRNGSSAASAVAS